MPLVVFIVIPSKNRNALKLVIVGNDIPNIVDTVLLLNPVPVVTLETKINRQVTIAKLL